VRYPKIKVLTLDQIVFRVLKLSLHTQTLFYFLHSKKWSAKSSNILLLNFSSKETPKQRDWPIIHKMLKELNSE